MGRQGVDWSNRWGKALGAAQTDLANPSDEPDGAQGFETKLFDERQRLE